MSQHHCHTEADKDTARKENQANIPDEHRCRNSQQNAKKKKPNLHNVKWD